ncbi:NAD kinase [Methylopila jiangsuensis]|uniref:NAD kinase n=1 Tax=Methylopila jiangsuensis TaxID=586230 RepID=A0A9W6JEJ3_9HYPH|nr:NAD kinase [Methylopila jiangsuensis]MDR6286054.1 NAD+ kinase [Methylopila jiangsuensis]GLK75812.1 NAD kinase [Methylopila jiangsuensis]
MTGRGFERIAFVASGAEDAREARAALTARYDGVPLDQADVVVALGGDGMMLLTLHDVMGRNVPIYGMNRGSVGFLMNDFREEGLRERLAAAERTVIHPLTMRARDRDNKVHVAKAINEVALWRETYQAAKFRIEVDGKPRMPELICDGVLVATPAGSTAYNLSAHGPLLPLASPLLALTPISPFRPRRWRGALLPDRAAVAIDVLEAEKRPVAAVADNIEFRDVKRVEIALDRKTNLVMLHDAGHGLDERILAEQFGW